MIYEVTTNPEEQVSNCSVRWNWFELVHCIP